MKISLAKLKRSKPWTIKELDTALSDLKRNKPRDCEGLVKAHSNMENCSYCHFAKKI